ncbi:MAG: DUF5686 family protein [Flavobacteriales bacterium]
MFLFFTIPLSAQVRIEGKVLNASNGNGIPFVHIVPIDQEKRGTQSDLNGDFELELAERPSHLVVSSVGYEKDTVYVPKKRHTLRIELTRTSLKTQPVEVHPGKRPAIPIVKNAIRKRELHDPLNLKGFSYRSYTKLVYSDRSLAFDSAWGSSRRDSISGGKQVKVPDSLHAFIMETATRRRFQKGSYDKTIVKGAQVSGFQQAPLTAIASEFQDISFYRDHVKLMGEAYRSPISKRALKKYEYRLRNTLIQDGDTSYFIRFRPKPAKKLQGLQGMMVIRSGEYALRSIRATPAQKSPNPVRIEQRYEKEQGAYFPKRMSFEMQVPAYGMICNGRSYIEKVRVGRDTVGEVKRRDLSIQKAEGFGKRDSSFWAKHRPAPLTRKDSTTYAILDSVGKAKGFDRFVDVGRKLTQGLFPIGPFDIRLYEIYRYNAFEKNRLGFGFESNEKLSPYFRVGAYWGYGTGDERMKYGGDLEVRPTGNKEWRFGFFYRKDLIEAGRIGSRRFDRYFGRSPLFSSEAQRDIYTRRMIGSEKKGFRFRTGRPRYMDIGIEGSLSDEKPLYQTARLKEGMKDRKLRLVNTRVRLRFAYGERSMKSQGKKMILETPYPVLKLRFTKGWKGLGSGGERSYSMLFARVMHDFNLRGVGKGSFALDLAQAFGKPPLYRYYYAPGTLDREFPFFIPRSFNTADPYEFLHSRYLHFFFQQDLYRFTLHSDHSRPLLKVRHSMGWGDRSGVPTTHITAPSTMSKGYYESGLTVKDLIRFEGMEGFYAYGLGVSIAYRYGPYANPDPWKNLAYGIELSFDL